MNTGDCAASRVSAIVLAYNHEHYIAKAIESLLAQTTPVQIVVCDDASVDRTAEVAEEILSAAGWPNGSKLIRHPHNTGVATTFNDVVADADGEICFINEGDDYSSPERAERVLEQFERHPDIAMVGTALWQIDDENNPIPSQHHGNWSSEKVIREPFDKLGHRCVTGPAMAFRRSLIDKFGFVDKRVISVDLVLTYRALALGGIKLEPERLAYYRYFTGAEGITFRLYHWTESRALVKQKFATLLKDRAGQIEELEHCLEAASHTRLKDDIRAVTNFKQAEQQFFQAFLRAPSFYTLAVLSGLALSSEKTVRGLAHRLFWMLVDCKRHEMWMRMDFREITARFWDRLWLGLDVHRQGQNRGKE